MNERKKEQQQPQPEEFQYQQDQQQPQQVGATQTQYAGGLDPMSAGVLFGLKLETNKTLQNIECNWRGIVYDEETGQIFDVPNKEALMNEAGIQMFMGILKDIVHKETMQSFLSEEYIDKATIDFDDNVADLMFKNMKEYGIKSIQVANSIADDINHLIHCTLRRALNGGERRELSKTSEYKEVVGGGQQKSPGLFGGLFKKWKEKTKKSIEINQMRN